MLELWILMIKLWTSWFSFPWFFTKLSMVLFITLNFLCDWTKRFANWLFIDNFLHIKNWCSWMVFFKSYLKKLINFKRTERTLTFLDVLFTYFNDLLVELSFEFFEDIFMKLMWDFHKFIESKSITLRILLDIINCFTKIRVLAAFCLTLLFEESD